MQFIIVVVLLVLCFVTIRSTKKNNQKESRQPSPSPSCKNNGLPFRESVNYPVDSVRETPKTVIGPTFSASSLLSEPSSKRKPIPKYRDKPKLSVPWSDEKYSEILSLHDFCVLDIETTGLECWNCRIVQLGIIKVVDNIPVQRLNTYIDPETHIPTKATEIHGITDKDVIGAPTYSQIADSVYSILNNSVVIGHNVTFDLNFIQHILIESTYPYEDFHVDFVDTWEFANRLHLPVPDYKLQTLLQFYGIDPGTAHTAYDDAFATLQLFHALRYEYTHKQELEEKRAEEKKAERKKKREEEKEARRSTFAASPLLEQRFCFTGSFSLDREAMEKLAVSVGALVQEKEPNGKTSYLVKGDVSDLPEWALERKLRKAESLSAAGKPVKIISEDDYLQLISEAKAGLSASSEAVNP